MRLAFVSFLIFLAGCASTMETVLADDISTRPGPLTDEAKAMNHYLASLVYQRMNEPAKALEELRAAADLTPQSPWLQERLLAAYYQNEDYENAIVMAHRAIKNDPENILLHIWLGQMYFKLERFDEATETFRTAIALDPERMIGYEALVEVEEETHDLVGALRVYEELLEVSPDSDFLYYRLGLNLAKIDDTEGAQAALEKAVELNPEMAPAQFLLGVLYQDLGKPEKSVEQMERFLQTNPDNVAGNVNLAGSKARLGDYDEAIALLTALIDGGQAEPRHHVERLYLWLRSGSLGDPSLAVAPSGAPIAGTFLEALIRKQHGEPYGKIVATLDTIDSDADGEFSQYIVDLLSLFGRQETGEFLLAETDGMLREGADSKTLEVFRARLLMGLEREEEAADALLAIVNRHGGEKWLHYHLAGLYDTLKRRDDAEIHLKAALEIDQNDPDIMNFLGYLYAEENRNLDEAEELLDRALLLDPENGFYLDSMGWIQYRKGDAGKAIEYIKRAIRSQDMENDDAILRDHLGDAYFLNGHPDAAIAEWRRALRLDPDIEGVQEKIDRALLRLRE